MGAKKRDKRGADGKAEMIHQGDKQKLAVPDIKLGSKPPRFARFARLARIRGSKGKTATGDKRFGCVASHANHFLPLQKASLLL